MRRLCRFTAGFALGCAACVLGLRGGAWMAAGAAAVLAVLAAFFLPRMQVQLRGVKPALLGLAAALLFCAGYRAAFLRPTENFCAQQQAQIQAEVLDDPTASRYGSAVLVRVKTGGAGVKAVLYYRQDAALSPGDHISCTAKLRAADPDDLERDEYYASRGVWAVLSAKGQMTIEPGKPSFRHLPALAARRLKDVCAKIFPEDVSGFLTALLTGDKQGLGYRLKNDLSRSGIYHVVAVSGMHVSLLAGIVMLLCANRRTLCAALGIPAVWFFVLLTGAGASSVRAGVMQTVLLLSGLVRRERDSWTAFSLALLLLLAENPWALRNVGLLLSFASTGGILLFAKPLYRAAAESKAYARLKGRRPQIARGGKPAVTAVCCSIASSAFSLPICAYYFKLMSVSGFLTNALCLWLVSLVFSAGLVTAVAACVWMPLSGRYISSLRSGSSA